MEKYLAEKRRKEEQERQAAAEAEQQRQERERRFREQQRKEAEAQRQDQDFRDQQEAKRKADQERWEAEQAEYNRETEDYARRLQEVIQKDREDWDAQQERQRAKDQAELERIWEDQERDRQARRERMDAEDRADKAERKEREAQEKLREAQNELARRDEQERERVREEARRQAHERTVTETARKIKETWQEQARTHLPDIGADVSNFTKIVHDMRNGGDSYSRTDLLVATDKLLERGEQAYHWITAPVETAADHLMRYTLNAVRAEAIDKVWQSPEYLRDSPLIHSIFRRIQEVNRLVHDSNPFTEQLSSMALDQIEAIGQNIHGELSLLETNLGSFHAPHERYADQPIINPFKSAGTKSSIPGGNPFLSSTAKRPPKNEMATDPVTALDFDSHNPFLKRSTSGANGAASTSKSKSAQTPKKTQIAADNPDGTPCSVEGVGPTTDECKKQRKSQSSKNALKAR